MAWYCWYAVSPPGKELCRPPAAEVTSHGRRRVVMLRTVSRWPDSNCAAQQGKASMEAYLAPRSSANERRFIMLVCAVMSENLAAPATAAGRFARTGSPLAKNCVLLPAT